MPIQQIDTTAFLEMAETQLVLDVRSPQEFQYARIPGAFSLPLFSDEERKIVGTIYKQQSREEAIKEGLVFFGPKMRGMIERTEQLLKEKNEGHRGPIADKVVVHCWRGGMRSAGIAWLLDLYGFTVFTLKGGYKSYRKQMLNFLEAPVNLQLLGGYTGSGKTAILERLRRFGARTIDLEALANHKGSSFGHLGQPDQPSQEMFENMLGMEIRKNLLAGNTDPGTWADAAHSIWVEDESLRIGQLILPKTFHERMRSAPCLFLEIPFEKRLDYIMEDYGGFSRDQLITGILRIQKRLGGLETKTAINHVIENNIRDAFAILLTYYDKWYLKSTASRHKESVLKQIEVNSADPIRNAQIIMNLHK